MNDKKQTAPNQEPRPKVTGLPSKNRGISMSTFLFVVALVATVSFVGGTRSQDLLAQIGGTFGIRVETGSIDLSQTQDVFRKLKANYDGDLDEAALIDGASRGLVEAAGDNYTVYMDAEEAQEFDAQLDGKVSGIGAEIGVRNNVPTILRVLDNSPAKKAGLQRFDTILAVNDEAVVNSTATETAQKIRGEEGTTVRLTINRNDESIELSITRASVTDSSVSARIEDGIGILTIRRFDQDTGELARREAEKFLSAEVRGVVLDLRDNGGGYLDQAQSVAGIWLENKVVVSERRSGKETSRLKSTGNPTLKGVRTVVLVNENSASASEIVAGALKDYDAATLVGSTTFGKGTVQQLFSLPNGQKLKITIARWHTPEGVNISDKGIEADVEVELTPEDANAGRDPQLEAAKRLP